MKLYVVFVITIALILAGCGKSAKEKELETGLNDQVMALHDAAMAQMADVNALIAQIGTSMAQHDSLAKAVPKLMEGHTSDDLTAANDKLAAVKKDMDTWMKAYKPYNAEMPHDQAVAMLNQDVQNLTNLKDNIETSVASAKEALATHTAFAQELAAKSVKKKK